MNVDKVNEVLAKMVEDFERKKIEAKRFDTKAVLPDGREARRHCHWMAKEALSWPQERLEKKMRWMGFIQGILWMIDGVSIEDLKKNNKPEDESDG